MTVGLVMTTVDCIIHLGGIGRPRGRILEVSICGDPGDGPNNADVPAPCVVVTQWIGPAHSLLVALVGNRVAS